MTSYLIMHKRFGVCPLLLVSDIATLAEFKLALKIQVGKDILQKLNGEFTCSSKVRFFRDRAWMLSCCLHHAMNCIGIKRIYKKK